ncbi:MAG TPA: hypothetical protein VGK42_07585 [Candidatus Dormibacteraeota bacterium]|jgi:hypothetical protein
MGKSVLTKNFAIAAEVAVVGLCLGSEPRMGQAADHAYQKAQSQTPWTAVRFKPQS